MLPISKQRLGRWEGSSLMVFLIFSSLTVAHPHQFSRLKVWNRCVKVQRFSEHVDAEPSKPSALGCAKADRVGLTTRG